MPRARDLNVFQVFDLRRGLDLKTSALTRALQRGQNSLTKSLNAVYTSSGAASKRFDRTTLTSTTVGAAVGITGGVQFNTSGGTSYNVFGTDDGKVYRLNADGTTTAISTGNTTGTKWFFATYNDKLIICNRADAPKKTTDANTVTALGGSPPATGGPVVVHGNRVFFLDATTKSKLTWSALNDEEDYTTVSNAGTLLVSANDGSNAIGLVPSINELIILKGTRPYRLQGTNPSTFALTTLVPTTGSVGAVSFTGNIFSVNDVVYVATNGVVSLNTTMNFGDIQARFMSEKVAPYFEPETAYTLSLQNLSNAVAVYDSQNNRIYVSVDSDADGKNDLTLIYDLVTEGWSTWDIGFASMWPVKSSTTGLVEIYAGTYTGHVQVLNRNVSTNAIDFHVRHLSCLNAPGIEKSPRYLFIYAEELGNVSLTGDIKYDFGLSGGTTFSVSLLGNSHTLGVNWVLGTDPLGVQDQVVKRVDLSGIGEFVEFGFRNVNAGEFCTLYGFEVMYRPRRTVRRAS